MPIRSVPPPSAIAPGVWSIPLPFPNPLGYTLTYSIQVDRGFILVDLGWDSPEAWDALLAGLRLAGARPRNVLGAVITHIHPDHFGLASRLKETSDAWLAVHPAELSHIAVDDSARDRFMQQMSEWLQSCGCPPSEFSALAIDAPEVRARLSSILPDVLLTDNEEVPETRGDMIALHTPGHTPGHLCLVSQERHLLFTGDHVLPRVTPNVSWRPDVDPNPLADFESSLERLRWYDDHLVLPGHEWAFDHLRERLDQLKQHHVERLDEVEAVVLAGAQTTWEVTNSVTWRRPFESLEPRARRSALGETSSHLLRLVSLGRLAVKEDEVATWTVLA